VFRSYRAPQDPNSALIEFQFLEGCERWCPSTDILNNPDPAVASEARSRWTDRYLYFLFFGPYETLHLKPNPGRRCRDLPPLGLGDFELYLGANSKTSTYTASLQISPQGEFLDQAIMPPRETGME